MRIVATIIGTLGILSDGAFAQGAVPIGEDAVKIGEEAMAIGEGAVPIGEATVPIGEGAEKVGEGAVKVGEDAVPMGEGAVPVGEGAVRIGEGAVTVGEGAVPVGEEAVRTDEAARQARLAKRKAAMNDPNFAHLFAGKPQSERISDAESRLADAIKDSSDLSAADLSERAAQNSAWAQGALASAKSRPADLFTREWWRKNGTTWSTDSYFATEGPEYWWKSTPWNEVARVLGLMEGTKPFSYVYDKNLVFKNDVIFVNGEPISSYGDFVESARIMAKSSDQNLPAYTRWTPLGTFALSTSLRTKSAPHAIQLVMDDRGNINGVYANWKNGSVPAIQGKVHRDTQRVAFQLGLDGKIVVETGLANLCEDVVRLWAHLPNEHSQTWLLVRMK